MTQFIRVRPADAIIDSQGVGQMRSRLESITGVGTIIEQTGEVFVVDANDGSAEPLADDLFNRILHHEPVEPAPLVRLVRLVAEIGLVLEAWYANDDADLPTFYDPDAAIRRDHCAGVDVASGVVHSPPTAIAPDGWHTRMLYAEAPRPVLGILKNRKEPDRESFSLT